MISEVIKVDIPRNSQIFHGFGEAHYNDAYQVDLSIPPTPSPQIALLFFKSFPPSFILLLKLRENLAKLVGLKNAKGQDLKAELQVFTGARGESIGLFHVIENHKNELIMGERDRHLDFRIGFHIQERPGGYKLSLITLVRFNHWSGRAYFFPVGRIHRWFMPRILRQMATKLEESA